MTETELVWAQPKQPIATRALIMTSSNGVYNCMTVVEQNYDAICTTAGSCCCKWAMQGRAGHAVLPRCAREKHVII